VFDVLHDENLFPYHLQQVQDLGEDDCPSHNQMSEWYMNQCNQIPNFAEKVLWTDESCFTREGPFNSRNSHIWNDVNPHGTYVNSYQRKFSVNIWAGIVGNVLLGPVLLPARLNGETYLAFHENVLPLYRMYQMPRFILF